jgi:hypothetical protein
MALSSPETNFMDASNAVMMMGQSVKIVGDHFSQRPLSICSRLDDHKPSCQPLNQQPLFLKPLYNGRLS